MRKISCILFAMMMALSVNAKSKMTFVVSGPEQSYNQIRVINETSLDDITCRVVIVEGEDKVAAVYGIYNLYGKFGSDTNTKRVWRGTTLGVQMPNDFKGDLAFDVEYKDYPLFDIIVIHLRDGKSGFDEKVQ